MSNCCKDKCWCRFLPHNWLCLKGLSTAFLVLFYITFLAAIVIAIVLCVDVWNMFTKYYADASTKELLFNKSLWAAWSVMLLQVIGIAVPSALVWLSFSKMLKVLGKIKHAVAPCCCHEEKAKEDKKEAKKTKEEAK